METKIERHQNLLCDEMLELYQRIMDEVVVYHRLPFKLFETLRSPERQRYLVDSGFSKTMHSRHLPNSTGKSEAFDLVLFIDNKWTWTPLHFYDFLGKSVLEKFGNKITWGGNFKNFYDGCHFELK